MHNLYIVSVNLIGLQTYRCSCDLYITGREGAAWIFPVHLLATPAAPDDIIIVEATGLNTEAQVCLRLTSLTEYDLMVK